MPWSIATVMRGNECFMESTDNPKPDTAAWKALVLKYQEPSLWRALTVGGGNVASGVFSTAIGANNRASEWGSFALGTYARSQGYNASALGVGTQATGPGQFVVGAFNQPLYDGDGYMKADNDALFIVGNGYQTRAEGYTGNAFTSSGGHAIDPWATPSDVITTRRNAFVVRWNGNTETSGTVQSTATTGYNKFKAPVLIAQSGDISMGEFTAGPQP